MRWVMIERSGPHRRLGRGVGIGSAPVLVKKSIAPAPLKDIALSRNWLRVFRSAEAVLSQSSIFGQNPKIGCQEFNDLQTPKLSKKQLCDRTERLRLGLMGGAGAGDRVAPGLDQVRCNRMKSHRSTNRAS